jgi:hypothetical protein
MDEIASGIYHWTAFHEGIGAEVSSYYVEPAATVLDPMEPAAGLDWFAGRNVHRVALTNRHHYRHADRFVDRFDVPVLVDEPGFAEIEGRPGAQSFEFGTEIAPGITAHAVEPSWPDEGVLQFDIGPGVLAIADGAVHYGETVHFVPDEHLGDDPERTKELLRAGYGRLLDLDFDVLLFAHGSAITEGGKEALRAFVHGEGG